MNRSEYLKALGVEEWKLREVRSVSAAKKHSQKKLPESFPFVCHFLNFGSLKLCFQEADKMLLKKQIWRDLAEFAVKNKQTEVIESWSRAAWEAATTGCPGMGRLTGTTWPPSALSAVAGLRP